MTRGFVVLAYNTEKTDYTQCARLLAHSIKNVMPRESISVITDLQIDDEIFDEQIIVKSIDDSEWKLSNDSLVYEHTPYDFTIKLEADLYIPSSIEYWWDVLKNRELNMSTTIRNYFGEISTVETYRTMIVKNNLPGTYNALTYFRRSELAKDFYWIVRDVFTNWSDYRDELKYCIENAPTTDTVYALAAELVGREHCTLPTFKDMSMVHMKPQINDLFCSEWNKELVIELNSEVFRINTIPQRYPVHYHVKKYASRFLDELNG